MSGGYFKRVYIVVPMKLEASHLCKFYLGI